MATGASNCRPRRPAGRRAQGRADPDPAPRATSSRCSASATSCWRSTRSTWSSFDRGRLRHASSPTFAASPRALGFTADRRRSRSRRATATMSSRRVRAHALVSRARRCSRIWKASTSRAALADKPFRLPVQWVNRPDLDFRGFSGTIAGGRVAPGDAVVVAAVRHDQSQGHAHRHLRRRPATRRWPATRSR